VETLSFFVFVIREQNTCNGMLEAKCLGVKKHDYNKVLHYEFSDRHLLHDFQPMTSMHLQSTENIQNTVNPQAVMDLDNQLSNRFIELDPLGYFLIYLDREAGLICAKHFTNEINEKGLAVDPDTGEPIPCNRKVERTHTAIYTGRTAKELGMKITEQTHPCPLSCLDHALYLGREFVRAEIALLSGTEYIQD